MRITTCVLALVAATLPACASKGTTPGSATGTGVLRLGSAPAAEVLVDGQAVGTTPLTHEISAGAHTIVLRAPAFRELSAEVDVAAGKTWEKTWVLTPQDPSDPVAIRTLAASFELAVVDLEPAVRTRAIPDAKRVVPLYPRGDVRLTSKFLHSGDLRIELLAFATPTAFGKPSASRNQLGLTHLSFSVDDLDAATERLVRHGGKVIEGTRSTPEGRIHIIFLADPDGTRIELMKQPKGVTWPWY